ncbi:uncharacterized protein LOC129748391 [Uranotaenia lowii]|uniref:uncharacterized protein LOC129748391 n=1 Tax=Uranotaenia lowii TaxID=190385 RepID=UPI002479F116|nr:uncharacterized protein LOC129748391 [Uranotaenia lowii]XP_055598975.1 uncharacterized protein LOC129748391 [Uranotaenia lowii]XP_055598976.1 uncharacterized protein LOC129748391 [Uranotaenia lowii]
MKSFGTGILLIGAMLLASGFAFPSSKDRKPGSDSSNPADDAEFIVVPLEHQRPSYADRYPTSFDGFDGVVDTDDFPHPAQGPIFFPSVNPFSWQFSSYFDDLIKRLRDRFAGSWNPFYGGAADFVPTGPGLWPVGIPTDDSSEDGQKNTTSTVKIIDGHKVIINDTYYTKQNEFGTSVYKVRVIDVKPLDEEDGSKSDEDKPLETGNRAGSDDKEPTTTPKATTRDTELESSDEETKTTADDNLNTIESNSDIDGPKKDEGSSSAIESFEGDFLRPQQKIFSSGQESLERSNQIQRLKPDREDSNSVEQTDEGFSPDEWKQVQDDRKRIIVSGSWDRFPVRNQNQNQGQFDIDGSSGGEVVDLTNDIIVNEMLADAAIPLHPDVEVFAPKQKRPAQQDPMQQFPGSFPQGNFPGGNRFPVTYPNQFPQQFPQQFPNQPFPQSPFPGQFPVQNFPVFRPQIQPQPMGSINPFGVNVGQPGQIPAQRPVQPQNFGGIGNFGQQNPVLIMTFPSLFREVRP